MIDLVTAKWIKLQIPVNQMEHGIKRAGARQVYSLDDTVELFCQSFVRKATKLVAVLTFRTKTARSSLRRETRVRTRSRSNVKIPNGTVFEIPQLNRSGGNPRLGRENPRSNNAQIGFSNNIFEEHREVLQNIFANISRNITTGEQANHSVPASSADQNERVQVSIYVEFLT